MFKSTEKTRLLFNGDIIISCHGLFNAGSYKAFQYLNTFFYFEQYNLFFGFCPFA